MTSMVAAFFLVTNYIWVAVHFYHVVEIHLFLVVGTCFCQRGDFLEVIIDHVEVTHVEVIYHNLTWVYNVMVIFLCCTLVYICHYHIFMVHSITNIAFIKSVTDHHVSCPSPGHGSLGDVIGHMASIKVVAMVVSCCAWDHLFGHNLSYLGLCIVLLVVRSGGVFVIGIITINNDPVGVITPVLVDPVSRRPCLQCIST